MKIVLPYNTHFGEYTKDKIVGGIEKFCHQIVDNFDDVHIINVDITDPIKDNTTKIKNFGRDIDADVIISNWHQASFSGTKISDSEIPIMFVNHSRNSLGSILSIMKNLRKKKHSVYMVSEHQHNFYRAMSKRLKADPVEVDGYLNSGYLNGDMPELSEIEYDCYTIGRCDPLEKKPFLLKEWLKDSDLKTLVMTNTPTEERGLKYLEKNSHWDGVLLDLKHEDVMKTVSKARTFFSTCWGETWGIAALEALSHGVPVILNSKNSDHATVSVCASNRHYRLVSDKSELIRAIKSFDVDRKEIQEMTWEKHSLDVWKSQFENAIDKTIEKHKPISLEPYFGNLKFNK